ncbi:MAG: hypothetical protein ACLRMZ_24510 [Blautia marasmi]
MYNQLVKGILILVKGIDAFIESIQSMCGSNDIIQSMESIEPYRLPKLSGYWKQIQKLPYFWKSGSSRFFDLLVTGRSSPRGCFRVSS